MKRFTLFILTLILMVSIIKLTFSEPQIEVTGYKLNPKEIYPGSEFTLTITLKNNSSNDKAKSVVVEIKKIEGKNDLSFFYPKNKTTTRKIEEIDVNKEMSVDFTFQVDKGAPTGIYRLIVNLSWKDEGDKNYSSEELISISISPPSIENRPLLTIKTFNTYPQQVEGGKSFNLNLNINNIGGKDAKNVKVEINRIEGQNTLLYFSPSKSGNIIYINNISKSGVYEAQFNFNVDENIKNGVYNFVVDMTYEDEARITYSSSEIVGINAIEKQDKAEIEILSYNVTPNDIIPGSEFAINIKIKNQGSLQAKSIKIYPSNIEGESSLKYFTIKGEGIKNVEILESEEEKDVQFILIADRKTETKLYNIIFTINYLDSKNKSYTSSKSIGVLISSDNPDLYLTNYSIDTDKIKPDTTFNLALTLENLGNLDAVDTKITLQNVEGTNSLYPFSVIEGSTTNFVNNIKNKDKIIVKFNLKVDKDALSKNYTLNISISYKDIAIRDYSKTEKVNLFVEEKEKSDEPKLIVKSVITDPKIISPGQNFKVSINILNNGGGIAKNSTIQYSGVGTSNDLYPFTPLDTSNTIYIGDIKPDEEKLVKVNFSTSSDAKDGVYNIILNLSYEDGEKYSESQKIGVVVKKYEPQKNLNIILSSYRVTPDVVNPGGIVEIEYTILNISKETGYNITHKIEKIENSNSLYPFSPISSSNIKTNNSIQGGGSVYSKLSFFVSPDAESKTYNLLFSITYEDSSGNVYEKTSSIGVVVLRKPLLTLFNFVYPERVKQNEKFTISCDIGNPGNYPVKGVIVFLRGLPVNGGDKFIGTLDSGNYDTYEYEITISEPNEYKGEFVVQYVDDSNNIHEMKKDFDIVVEKGVNGNGTQQKEEKLTFWQRLWRFLLRIFGIGK